MRCFSSSAIAACVSGSIETRVTVRTGTSKISIVLTFLRSFAIRAISAILTSLSLAVALGSAFICSYSARAFSSNGPYKASRRCRSASMSFSRRGFVTVWYSVTTRVSGSVAPSGVLIVPNWMSRMMSSKVRVWGGIASRLFNTALIRLSRASFAKAISAALYLASGVTPPTSLPFFRSMPTSLAALAASAFCVSTSFSAASIFLLMAATSAAVFPFFDARKLRIRFCVSGISALVASAFSLARSNNPRYCSRLVAVAFDLISGSAFSIFCRTISARCCRVSR